MYFGYAFFYFTRKSLTFVAPVLISKGVLTAGSFGLIGTAFYLLYGVSKFLSGIVSDRVNARYFMSTGLIITGVANILFGLSSHFLGFFIFWLINAIFQGWGWPPCAKLLTHWYPRSERGRWWSLWNTCHNVGGALIPLLISFLLFTFSSWKVAMIVPGVLGIVMGILLMVGLRDVPSSLGLPEQVVETQACFNEEAFDDTLSKWGVLKKYVLSNRYIWILAFAYVLIYVVRTAINDWGAVYLAGQVYDNKATLADNTMSFLEIGGFLGSLAAGWLSDIGFKGRRGQTNVIFSAGMVFAILMLWKLAGHSFILHALAIFLIGFFVFGPQMLIGVAAAELSHKRAAGAATGFVGLFGYLGAALTGYPMSQLISAVGWSGAFIVLFLCGILATYVLACTWSVTSRNKSGIMSNMASATNCKTAS